MMDRRELLKKAGKVAGKKATGEIIEKGLQVDKPTQQIVKDMIDLGENMDKKITRREFLGKLGERLGGRQVPKVLDKYKKVTENLKFSYIEDILHL